MHVLITRPERDAADLKARLEARGCQVTVAPLIKIELNAIAADAFDQASAIVATSRNGLRALSQSPALDRARGLPLFVVGPATAALAGELGFADVRAGAGTAEGLLPAIRAYSHAQSARLVHLCGDHLAFDLGGALKDDKIMLTSLPAYRSVTAETLTQPVERLLAKGAIDAVVLMSPRTARVWSALTRALPIKPDLSKVRHICLSQAVADALKVDGMTATDIARQPNSDEIVALVYRLAGAPKTG